MDIKYNKNIELLITLHQGWSQRCGGRGSSHSPKILYHIKVNKRKKKKSEEEGEKEKVDEEEGRGWMSPLFTHIWLRYCVASSKILSII
jgi:hypothetical protein